MIDRAYGKIAFSCDEECGETSLDYYEQELI